MTSATGAGRAWQASPLAGWPGADGSGGGSSCLECDKGVSAIWLRVGGCGAVLVAVAKRRMRRPKRYSTTLRPLTLLNYPAVCSEALLCELERHHKKVLLCGTISPMSDAAPRSVHAWKSCSQGGKRSNRADRADRDKVYARPCWVDVIRASLSPDGAQSCQISGVATRGGTGPFTGAQGI